MTEYQVNKYKEYKKEFDKKNRKAKNEIKERDNMINMAMRFVFEFEDPSAAMRYVKWKVRRMREVSA